jgi:hypothetical protein
VREPDFEPVGLAFGRFESAWVGQVDHGYRLVRSRGVVRPFGFARRESKPEFLRARD